MELAQTAVVCRDIPSFPGYRARSDGSIWSCRLTGKWRALKPSKCSRFGHLVVYLCRNGKPVSRLVHRLVLEAFVGPCPPGMQCRHLDGNPTNNALENLCWGTPKEDRANQRRHGTVPEGESHPLAKLTEDQVAAIRFLSDSGWTAKILSDHFLVDGTTIYRIQKGRTWKHFVPLLPVFVAQKPYLKNAFEIRGETTAIFLRQKDGGWLEALISTEDLPKLRSFPCRWYAKWHIASRCFYAAGNSPLASEGRKLLLHRYLLNAPANLRVDHLNHDGLDNRRCNLRLVPRGRR
jgi:hypothetical protein